VKILDFGIARAEAASAITRTGVLMGTPGYTAPEQARGARAIDARVDVFALGCVLFECLTGRAAFSGEHVMAVLAKILLEEPPRFADMVSDAPPELDALIARLLAKEPDQRPADGAEVVRLIDALAAGPAGRLAAGTITPTPRAPTIGSDEQRFMTLIVCADVAGAATAGAVRMAELPTLVNTPAPGSPAQAVDPTLAPEGAVKPEAVDSLVKAHGARLEPLVDGSWVVTLAGSRQPATDQAAQAARLALALKRQLPGARIAVASGRGLAARVPLGEVIDRAVTLLGPAALPGLRRRPREGVAVDTLTSELLGARFRILDDGLQLRVVGEREDAEPERRLLGKPTPFVGRDRELATLLSLFEECVDEPAARAVLVRAPAGLGKSRLRDELLRALSARGHAFELLEARGDPMRAGAPFAMAAQLVRRAARILDGEALDSKRAKLEARLSRVLTGEEGDRVTAFLGELADVPPKTARTGVELARRDPMVMGDQLRRAFEDWLAAEATVRPVVLALDDLQLGDLPTVTLVSAALRHLRERPFIVVAFARPEIRQLFPGLWNDRQVHELALPELGKRAATRLTREVLPDADDATVDRLVAQAAGNAFYLEELIRVQAEGETPGALPGTVLAMAQARLEGLPAAARRLLRAASVYGERFTAAGVAALLGEDVERSEVDRLLGELVEREVLERLVPARFHGQDEYRFRHALVREAARAMLTDADRTLGHRLAAEWLEGAGVTDAALLAEHWSLGGVPERAVAGWLQAARDALEGSDLASVLTHVDRGLGAGARGDALGELLVLRSDALRWRGDFTASAEAGSLASAVLPRGSRIWCEGATVLLTVLWSLQHYDRMVELVGRVRSSPRVPGAEAMRFRALAKGVVQLFLAGRYDVGDELLASMTAELGEAELADPGIAARLCEARAFSAGARAEQGTCLELLSRAAAAYRGFGDLRNASMVTNNVGYTYIQLGAYEDAVRTLEQTLRDSQRVGTGMVTSIAQQNLGLALGLLGERERGEAVERESQAAFRKQLDMHMVGIAGVYLAIIRLAAGDAADAEREAAEGAEQVGANAPGRALALAVLARARLSLGKRESAVAAAHEAYGLLESLGGLDEGEGLVRLAWAEALEAAGRLEEARAVVTVALARLAELGKKLDDTLRASFLGRVPEHAALCALAVKLGVSVEA
jgi:tetratricopeptide (TPR) repeat protein